MTIPSASINTHLPHHTTPHHTTSPASTRTPSTLTVRLDGTKLPSTFAAYCGMLPGTLLLDKCPRWEVAVLPAADKEVGHLSFVNGIHTRTGGTHVTHVTDQLCKVLADQLKAKHKLELRKGLLREGLLVVVNALVENPTFEGQCKHQLTTKAKDFGSRYTPSASFLAKLKKGGMGIGKSGGLARLGLQLDQRVQVVDERLKDMYAVDHYLERERGVPLLP